MIHAVAEWVFSYLCHQDAARSWAPGGSPLALCQRCVGVYAGAALMVLLLPLMRFKPTRSLCGLHALFVFQMVILGGHLLPHSATVRTLSGHVFIIGASYFLWNSLRYRWALLRDERSPRNYLLGILAVLLGLQLSVHAPFSVVAPVVEFLALVGLSLIALAASLTIGDLISEVTRQKRVAKGD